MTAYYNEFDPFAAEWLRQLIKAGHIADGVVDERSIVDVRPEDLTEFTQCHFFAGIGGWSRALRLAGWPDDRPVWTGSPPCQPFSTAGKQLGVKDERHLAPVWLELVKACKPVELFGEQVAAAVKKDDWLDDLQDTLGGEGYATGEIVLPAGGIGAPHLRQRLWIVAKRLGDAPGARLERGAIADRKSQKKPGGLFLDRPGNNAGGMADTGSSGRHKNGKCESAPRSDGDVRDTIVPEGFAAAGPLHGSWAAADWLFCRDGEWRPVEPGTFPLADGVPNRVERSHRVGALRGYGNAIVPEVAAEVIGAAVEIFDELTPVSFL